MDKNVKIGDVVEAEIIGLQDYGCFVKFHITAEKILEYKGLIHISEIQSGFIKNIHEVVKLNQKIKAQIIDIDEYSGKISLSMRSLEEAPKVHHYYRKKYFTDNRLNIGFSSLDKHLKDWVRENEAYLSQQQKRK
ncbi:CvfD/Ygs/GSP13 family RNA-binding post-transcriptional regulator [Lactococcus termiticola]|uniref:RNA-binding protein n=1 Tax=Lactococcus termiticola TaxID=2169526 RepID=A0A2R5HEX3_9LACT|nr:CvfD/Ygs/GSP13 family RNA-binding post-transcriptional regulator [Lactococcus termiticola]GBG96614.1 RNA-binding protein [Lactococcus termiticola]